MDRRDKPKYIILGFYTENTFDGSDAESPADTLVEAKRRAKCMMTPAYQRVCESSRPITRVQIIRGDECIEDYFVWKRNTLI